MGDHLALPHGGRLVNLVVEAERARELRAASLGWPSWELTPRQVCDLELLLGGGFSPLGGFLTRGDYEAVCASMRLADGRLWPIPVVLDVAEDVAGQLGPGATLALRDPEGVLLAALHVEEIWRPDRLAEAEAVYGTTSRAHPGVARILDETHASYIGGRVEGIQPVVHHDFPELRLTPEEVRAVLTRIGAGRAVAFQTRNPLHRAHWELTVRAAAQIGAHVLLHPAVGMTKPGDVDHYTRVRCYQAVLARYPPGTATLALAPLAMRLAGPREALLHAIIRKNYGCTHLIVGRDHAGPGHDPAGRPFYSPYAAQDLVRAHERELGVGMVAFKEMVYVQDLEAYLPEDEVPAGARTLALSGTDLRRRLAEGREIPAWFTFPEVAAELRRRFPPRHRQGFTVFFTGLPSSGKSTLGHALQARLLEMGERPVTLLDGDVVRKQLSSELGFSRAHRDLHIRRLTFVAAEITKSGGIVLCTPIAPYDSVRREARAMIEPWGGFVLVHVATPLEVCERRDRKGLFAKARAGLIEQFTGISDPYEPPSDAEVVVDTSALTLEEAARAILLYLEGAGYLGAGRKGSATRVEADRPRAGPSRSPGTSVDGRT